MPTVNVKFDFSVSTTTDRIDYGKFEIAHRADEKVERKIISLKGLETKTIETENEFKFICVFVMTFDVELVFNIVDKDGGYLTLRGRTVLFDTYGVRALSITNDKESTIEVVVFTIE